MDTEITLAPVISFTKTFKLSEDPKIFHDISCCYDHHCTATIKRLTVPYLEQYSHSTPTSFPPIFVFPAIVHNQLCYMPCNPMLFTAVSSAVQNNPELALPAVYVLDTDKLPVYDFNEDYSKTVCLSEPLEELIYPDTSCL